jgi:branched-chain amino acid transport system substrate-binding protein
MYRLIPACLFLLCFAIAAAAEAQDQITIGIVTATSGPLAAPGKFQINGFNLAVDEINKKGGVVVSGKTYKLALKIYDTHCSATEGASAMERLASFDKVPVVLGELCSPVAAAEAVVAQSDEVPLILTVPTASNLTKPKNTNPYLFRVNADGDLLDAGLAKYIAAQDWSPLGFIAWNNDTGRGGVANLTRLLPPNIETAYIGYFNVGDVDFSSHVSNLRAKNVKAILLYMDEEPGALATKQIRQSGLQTQLVGTLAMGSNKFLERVDAKSIEGMVQYSNFPPGAAVPAIRNFNIAYKAMFNEESHGFAAQSYDGLMVALAAMQRAGTVTDGKAIRDALAKTDYQGVIGHIVFDANNQNNPPVFITQWCGDGTRRIVAPPEAIGACGTG